MGKRQTQPRIDVEKYPYDPQKPFAHMGAAIRAGTGSRDWNLFLASLPERDRAEAVRSARGMRRFEQPACYWPRAREDRRAS